MSIHPVMQRLADKLRRTDLPTFVPGDTVRGQVKIKEGDKERLQAFEGIVIALKNGAQGSFTVRKMSFGEAVERGLSPASRKMPMLKPRGCANRYERAARANGAKVVAGVDEVGRGALF